jgi:hypothetical protein
MTPAPETTVEPHRSWLGGLAIYIVMVVAALAGIAYTSVRVQGPDGMGPRLTWVWLALVPLYFGVCVWQGWSYAKRNNATSRLLMTQGLHWLAFVGAMTVVMTQAVRGLMSDDALGLVLLMLLALGTFVAGVHAWSLPICLTGIALAVLAMSVGWIEETVLALLLAAAGALAVLGLMVLLRRHFAPLAAAAPLVAAARDG